MIGQGIGQVIGKWKALTRKLYNHSAFRTLEDVVYELPDGTQGEFSLYKQGRAGAVLALTKGSPSDQRVILARQFRPGPDAVLDELPGGGFHKDESLEDGIRRELLEETGYAPGEIRCLGRVFECAYATVERYAFIATDCVKVAEPHLDPHEWIDTVLKPVPEFFEQLKRGQATDLEIGWAGLEALGYLKFEIHP